MDVRKANLQIPDAVTAPRKHLTTICQIFAMPEEDVEQLATFLGQTEGIHRKDYRLTDHVF